MFIVRTGLDHKVRTWNLRTVHGLIHISGLTIQKATFGRQFIMMFIIRFIGKKIIKLDRLNYLLICFLIMLFFIVYLPIVYSIDEPTRVISGDYRIHFFMISFIFIVFFTINNHFLSNNYVLFLYLFSFVSSSLLYLGLNWQYERLCMIMLIPYMLSTGIIFNKKSCYFLWNFLFCSLFFATVFTGMFDSLK